MNLADLTAAVRAFAVERDWEQFHTPRNLTLAIGGEVGELMELFQWKHDAEASAFVATTAGREAVAGEVADVLIYVLRLADVCEIDLEAAALRKLQEGELRYPADEVRGSARKQHRVAGSFQSIWTRIVGNAGSTFRQKRGGEFTYEVVSGCVVPDRTNRQLPRSQFEKASERLPVTGPGEFQDLQGPSYLFAILTDARIAGDGPLARRVAGDEAIGE